jgi:zinc transport system substrate-binding protein
MIRRFATVCLMAMLALSVGCGDGFTGGKRKVIVVDSFILQDYCDSLIGADADILFPVPVGEVPEDWTPTSDDIAKIQKADLILLSGGNVSEWAEKVSLPTAKVVKTWEGYKDKLIEIKVGVPHRHGDGPEHQHEGIVGFTWFDDELALAQLEAVKNSLSKLLPSAKPSIEERFEETRSALVDLFTGIEANLTTLKNLKYVGSHPNYHYLARRHNLSFEYVHWEPSVMPTEEQLAELKALKPDIFIWEATPLEAADKAVQDLKIATFVIPPISGAVENSYWQKEMANNRETLKNIYKYFKKLRETGDASQNEADEEEPKTTANDLPKEKVSENKDDANQDDSDQDRDDNDGEGDGG